MKKIDFNINIVEDIFYKNVVLRRSYKELSKEYNLHPTTICKKMKDFKSFFGIKEQEKYCLYTYLRYYHGEDIKEKYLSGQSTTELAKEYWTSDDHLIATLLRELGVKIRPTGYQSHTDQTLFKEITSEIEAYTLGLITADGSIDKNYSIRIFLTEADNYVLKDINSRLLDNTGYITTDLKKRGNPVSRLSFCGKKICENLANYGIVPSKSNFLTDIYILPENLMHHYIRGLFDGDGVASKNKKYLRIGFCAKRKEFVESCQSFLCEKLHMRKNKIFNTGNCYQCSWGSKTDIQKFYDYIYKDATIFLGRKKNKIFTYLSK